MAGFEETGEEASMNPHGGMVNATMTRRSSRRAVLGRVTAAAAFGGSLSGGMFDSSVTAMLSNATPVATPVPAAPLTELLMQDFAADVETAMRTFRVPGASVALVHNGEIVFNRGFGVKDLVRGEPVTPRTRFRIASNTKSMSALLLATLVDEGVLGWDQPVVDLWPRFRAPTADLTRSLRLRDLLGMASGIAESDTVRLAVAEFFMMAGLLSADDVLQSVADLPVVAPPEMSFSYNNTLVAVAAFVGLLAQGVTGTDGLLAAFAARMRDRLFAPIGMDDAAIIDDPRPLGADYAGGYAHDLFGVAQPLPFTSINGIAPAGSAVASSTDMARYLVTQMDGGVAPEGTRVVSARNLAETHRSGIAIAPGELFLPEQQPDTVSLHYALGWFVETFRDGRRLIWHAGGIDGFDSQMGFFPEERIGFAVLTNLDTGSIFNLSVQSSLLGRLFGLNRDLAATLARVAPLLDARSAELAAQTEPVDPIAIAPYLGLYEDGFRLRFSEDGALFLDHDIRSMPVLGLADGEYVVTAGPGVIQGQKVAFAASANGTPTMTIAGFAPVRWLTGG
jgi:beta-lactamase class C